MSGVTAGLGRLSKTYQGHPLSLPVPSMAELLSCSWEDSLDVPHSIQSGSTRTMRWAGEGHTEKSEEPRRSNLPGGNRVGILVGTDWQHSGQYGGKSSSGVWKTTNMSQGRAEEQREGGQHPGDI